MTHSREKQGSGGAQLLKNILTIGAGGALGTGAGYGIRGLLRKAALKEVATGAPGISKWLPYIGGAAGLLGGAAAAASQAKDMRNQELLMQAMQKSGSWDPSALDRVLLKEAGKLPWENPRHWSGGSKSPVRKSDVKKSADRVTADVVRKLRKRNPPVEFSKKEK
jgi:hypothetical protein